MPECGYPSPYVVDTHANRPPLPPRLSRKRQRLGAAQTLLFMLVSLALFGMFIEAYLIYHFHISEYATSGSSSKLIADVNSPTERPSDVLPSKPVAHLTGGQDVVHKSHIMAWSINADPTLYEMDYKDRCLVFQKEGYYHVYSKVYFFSSEPFEHSIHWRTKRYKGKSIPLLSSTTHPESSHRKKGRYHSFNSDQKSNSYLGGVFHFYKDDAIFVHVSNSSQIVRSKPFENIFGAFMI
ncbi:tumor necrosis factor ligand superfamily member 14 [Labrus bergylta]|uniref:TNF superfamily member 14 n=1 Tax=Labrus bergylta TaxID=56723 RepID=A0A3Q3GDI2_9LABR|nr:tumor necrosis factor ligand superfamily member 6-like [Labrus bergylta]